MSGAGRERPLRILHVFRSPVGGLFRYVLDICRGQVERGHAVGLLCDSTTGGERAEQALAEIAPALSLGVHRFAMARNPGASDLRGLWAMRRLVREALPDVLHGHGAKGGLFTRLPAFTTRNWPAVVYTTHGGSFHFLSSSPRDRLYRAIESALVPQTDLFLMESAYIARQVEENIGPLRRPVRVVHHGLTDAEFRPVPEGLRAFDFLYLGEMRALKGVDTLLEALALLRAENLAPRTLLVGAGPDEALLKAQAASLGLGDRVTFSPPRPIREALPQARFIVIPSRNESLSYVALESAGAQMPAIATAVGGIPEVFGPFADRLIPSSDPAVLAQALAAALARPEAQTRSEAAALGDYVRAYFSYASMVDGGIAAYREALAHRQGRRAD